MRDNVIMKITGKDLRRWEIPQGPVYKLLLSVIEKMIERDPELSKNQIREKIDAVLLDYHSYENDELFGEVANLYLEEEKRQKVNELVEPCEVNIFGIDMIEQGAIDQINMASRLPISLQASCMPDGHQGYGLPIGGVLATDNAVIPYAVGVDIGCRMHMTITNLPFKKVEGLRDKLRNALIANTVFGAGQETSSEHPIKDDERFNHSEIKRLKNTALKQLGTSGSGNHFVDFGKVILEGGEERFAILSHSGSRGFGANVANMYTKIAMDKCKLPKEAKHLAWLSLDESEGQEYWAFMNLAGDYAKACHEVIHGKILKDLKLSTERTIQNHHNFAWKEKLSNGQEAIVHRKGATPAGKGDIGIIPGSMTSPTFIVKGLGNAKSINSSSHGAGRRMSRTKAFNNFTGADMSNDLIMNHVELIGGDIDESSFSYKDIRKVIGEQKELVEVIGEFTPWMVRMDGIGL